MAPIPTKKDVEMNLRNIGATPFFKTPEDEPFAVEARFPRMPTAEQIGNILAALPRDARINTTLLSMTMDNEYKFRIAGTVSWK